MKQFNDWFSSIPELETKHFILNAFTRMDMDEYFDILRDPEVQKYLADGVRLFDKEPHITNWLNNINNRLLKQKLVFTWCVREKGTNRIVGRIDLGGFNKKKVAEISYHFARAYWHQGYGTEIVKVITDFGLNELMLKRIQGIVRKENIGSIRVLEHNGYIKEGELHYYPIGREFHDVIMLAIINKQ